MWYEQRFDERAGRMRFDCTVCGRGMWFPPSKHGKYLTCGGACAASQSLAARATRVRQCETCGASFVPRTTQVRVGHGRYCSQACNAASHQALNAPGARAKSRRGFLRAIESGRYVPLAGERNGMWKGGEVRRQERIAEYIASDQAAKRIREWRARNPERAREQVRRRKGRMIGRLPPGTVARIGEAQRWKCAVCRRGIRRSYHVDHRTPLALGGKHEPLNIELLCGPCNFRKNAKDPITFMQERGFLL